MTTILDPGCPAEQIVALYHQRWEIETAFLELKQTILGGRVLRARTPSGLDQEIYALLVTYQALRIAIADATIGRPDVDPDRASFTIALSTARDQLVIADTVIDLIGTIGRHVLNNLMPDYRLRTTPPRRQTSHLQLRRQDRPRPNRGPSYKATINSGALITAVPHLPMSGHSACPALASRGRFERGAPH